MKDMDNFFAGLSRRKFMKLSVLGGAIASVSPRGLELALAGVAQGASGGQVGDPAALGQWSPVINMVDATIHLLMQPDGKAIFFGLGAYDFYPCKYFVFDIAANTLTDVRSERNFIGAGMTHLRDGRMMFAGGTGQVSNLDLQGDLAYIYDPNTQKIQYQSTMHWQRRYTTFRTLANGDVLVMAGTKDSAELHARQHDFSSVVNTPELWSQSTGQWQTLPDATFDAYIYYPWVYQLPDGRVFVAGAMRNTTNKGRTCYIDFANGAKVTEGPQTQFGERDLGCSVMYEPGKILIMGGSRDRDYDYNEFGTLWATNTCEVIDLNQPNPQWRSTSSMQYRRKAFNATLLPDGSVMVTGGTQIGDREYYYSKSGWEREISWELNDPTRIGNSTLNGVSVCSVPLTDNRLEAYLIKPDGTTGYITQQTIDTDTWSSFVTLGSASNTAQDLAAARRTDGKADVIIAGTDNKLYWAHQATDGAWGNYQLISNTLQAKRVSLTRFPDDRLSLFFIDQNGNVQHLKQNTDASWAAPELMGTTSDLATDVAAVRLVNGLAHVAIIVGNGNMVFSSEYAANTWTGFNGDGRMIGSSNTNVKRIALSARADGKLDAFAVTTNGATLVHKDQLDGSDWNLFELVGRSSAYQTQDVHIAPRADGYFELCLANSSNALMHVKGPFTNYVLPAEIWDPKTEKWTTVASNTIPRTYHSVAALMQDGRVWAGGGGFGHPPGIAHPDGEIFSPPYLFKGDRPAISNAPVVADYNEKITIETANAADISQVTLLKLASVTHSHNMGQLFFSCAFTKTVGAIQTTITANPNELPPGYYYLFILNSKGVPSVGKTIRIGKYKEFLPLIVK